MKIFEYMAIGRPIVASRLEQLGDVLEHERTALLVPPGDVDKLAEGIERVLAAPDRGASLGRAAREEVERSHTWDRRAADVLDGLARVVS
jgi:glycosyltransferase involved in cell wall biosynthesis